MSTNCSNHNHSSPTHFAHAIDVNCVLVEWSAVLLTTRKYLSGRVARHTLPRLRPMGTAAYLVLPVEWSFVLCSHNTTNFSVGFAHYTLACPRPCPPLRYSSINVGERFCTPLPHSSELVRHDYKHSARRRRRWTSLVSLFYTAISRIIVDQQRP